MFCSGLFTFIRTPALRTLWPAWRLPSAQLIIAMIFEYVSLQLEGEDLALVAATLRDKTPAAVTRMAQQPKSRGLSDALLS